MKRPSFQFYPGDWRANAKLRRCTHAERGIWLEVLCLMHDSEEYGVLRWPLKDIAQAVGCRLQELRVIAEKGVLKGADVGPCAPLVYTPRHARKDGAPVTLLPVQDGPVWYSSRMVVDEYRNAARGASTRFPAKAPSRPHGDSPSHAPTHRQGDGPSSSSSTSPLSPPSGGNGSHEPKGKRNSACPDPFEVTDQMASWAVDAGVPPEALKPQTEKFLDHHRSKGNTFRDWPAAWRNWMRKAVEFGKQPVRH